MDWTQVFVILGVFSGMFLYLTSKIDGLRKDLTAEVQKNREEILWIKFRLDPNEHPEWKKPEEKKEN